jgi:hypothetical protein
MNLKEEVERERIWKRYLPAYGDDSSLSALTFMPPVILVYVSRPDKSVTWMKVLLKVAMMWQTPKVFSVGFPTPA